MDAWWCMGRSRKTTSSDCELCLSEIRHKSGEKSNYGISVNESIKITQYSGTTPTSLTLTPQSLTPQSLAFTPDNMANRAEEKTQGLIELSPV